MCTSPQNYTGLTVGAHTFSVRAIDESAQVDASPATYSWTVQTDTPPDTAILTTPPAQTLATSATFTFSGTDDHSSPEDLTFQCKLDSGAFASCTSPQSYSELAVGAHTFSVRAVDESAQVDASPATYSWTVQTDTVAPNTAIVTKPSARTSATSATFTFSGTDDHSSPEELIFECSLDGGAFALCTSPQSYSGLAATRHSFSVRAKDEFANVDPSPGTYAWVVHKERIRNGGLNTYVGPSRGPQFWVKNGFAATDGRDASVKKEGSASLRISGGRGTSKTLTQTVSLSGVAGDRFAFSFWARGASIPSAGTCQAQVLLFDGATLKSTKSVSCRTGTYARFQKRSLTFTAATTYTKAVIRFTYRKSSGKVWFDQVSLIR